MARISTDTIIEGLTFDDVLLVPAESEVLPNDVSTRSRLTRSIPLEIPGLTPAERAIGQAFQFTISTIGIYLGPIVAAVIAEPVRVKGRKARWATRVMRLSISAASSAS